MQPYRAGAANIQFSENHSQRPDDPFEYSSGPHLIWHGNNDNGGRNSLYSDCFVNSNTVPDLMLQPRRVHGRFPFGYGDSWNAVRIRSLVPLMSSSTITILSQKI